MALIKCPECGKEISDRAVQCPNCGFQSGQNPMASYIGPSKNSPIHPCHSCGSINVSYEMVTEPYKTNWLLILFYIFLALTCCGFLVLIPILLRQKSHVATYAICRDCGNKWNVAESNLFAGLKFSVTHKKNRNISDYIIIILAGLIILLIIVISVVLLKK